MFFDREVVVDRNWFGLVGNFLSSFLDSVRIRIGSNWSSDLRLKWWLGGDKRQVPDGGIMILVNSVIEDDAMLRYILGKVDRLYLYYYGGHGYGDFLSSILTDEFVDNRLRSTDGFIYYELFGGKLVLLDCGLVGSLSDCLVMTWGNLGLVEFEKLESFRSYELGSDIDLDSILI